MEYLLYTRRLIIVDPNVQRNNCLRPEKPPSLSNNNNTAVVFSEYNNDMPIHLLSYVII